MAHVDLFFQDSRVVSAGLAPGLFFEGRRRLLRGRVWWRL
jgi:hypothetical protein